MIEHMFLEKISIPIIWFDSRVSMVTLAWSNCWIVSSHPERASCRSCHLQQGGKLKSTFFFKSHFVLNIFPLKINGWKMKFPLRWPTFTGELLVLERIYRSFLWEDQLVNLGHLGQRCNWKRRTVIIHIFLRSNELECWFCEMGASKNNGTPKWMVYKGKPY